MGERSRNKMTNADGPVEKPREEVVTPERTTAMKGMVNASCMLFAPALVIVLAVVIYTCWPLFSNPQLEPDDFRYLHNVQLLKSGSWADFMEFAIVENRWDHLWWISLDEKVRFFRPTVVLSYWLDTCLYGKNIVLGLLLTNMLIHIACAFLVAVIFYLWFGAGLPAVMGSLLFAAFYCHGEAIWYIAGRTDSLAALGFLAGLLFHISGRRKPCLRYIALPCYALALFTKELAVSLPMLCFLHDQLIERRAGGLKKYLRDEWKLYAGYGLIAAGIWIFRSSVMKGDGTSFVHPYLISPFDTGFPAHLWMQIRNYGENLLIGTMTKPFMQTYELDQYSSVLGLVLIISAAAVTIIALNRDRYFIVFVAMAIITWLPTCFVYLSERYLYLPSVAIAAIAARLLDRAKTRRFLFILLLGGVLFWAGHQAWNLRKEHEIVSKPGIMQSMQRQLNELPGAIPKGAELLIVNLPGNSTVQAQFTEYQLRVQLDDPTLEVDVLTLMPTSGDMGENARLFQQGGDVLLVHGGSPADASKQFSIHESGTSPFPAISYRSGARITREDLLDYSVEIVAGQKDRCNALRFDLPKALEDYIILRFHAHPDLRMKPGYRQLRGRVEAVDTLPERVQD